MECKRFKGIACLDVDCVIAEEEFKESRCYGCSIGTVVESDEDEREEECQK